MAQFCGARDLAPRRLVLNSADGKPGMVYRSGALFARESSIGQRFPSPYQLDRERIATYRDGLGEHCGANALRAIVVDNRGNHLGNLGKEEIQRYLEGCT